MEGAEEVLVVILSAVLALFLVLGVVLVVLLIKLTKSINRIAEKAEHAVGNVESVAAAFKTAAGPLAVGKFLMNIAETVIKKRGKG